MISTAYVQEIFQSAKVNKTAVGLEGKITSFERISFGINSGAAYFLLAQIYGYSKFDFFDKDKSSYYLRLSASSGFERAQRLLNGKF